MSFFAALVDTEVGGGGVGGHGGAWAQQGSLVHTGAHGEPSPFPWASRGPACSPWPSRKGESLLLQRRPSLYSQETRASF